MNWAMAVDEFVCQGYCLYRPRTLTTRRGAWQWRRRHLIWTSTTRRVFLYSIFGGDWQHHHYTSTIAGNALFEQFADDGSLTHSLPNLKMMIVHLMQTRTISDSTGRNAIFNRTCHQLSSGNTITSQLQSKIHAF